MEACMDFRRYKTQLQPARERQGLKKDIFYCTKESKCLMRG